MLAQKATCGLLQPKKLQVVASTGRKHKLDHYAFVGFAYIFTTWVYIVVLIMSFSTLKQETIEERLISSLSACNQDFIEAHASFEFEYLHHAK